MSSEGESTQVPGWVILRPDLVPDVWRSRAVPAVLVPLMPAEAIELLSAEPVKEGISAADLPLIRLVARGQTAAEIARTLHTSQRTVYRRVARLRDEFGVSTMEQLATELARRGF